MIGLKENNIIIFQMYNKIAKNLINEVFSIHGKKDNDVNINVLKRLKNQIKLTIPQVTNNRIRYDLGKSKEYLLRKIKRATKLKKDSLSNNNFYNKLRKLITIQKIKTNNIEELQKLIKEKNKIVNELKKKYKYIDNNYIKNLLKNIEKLENNNGPTMELSYIRKDILNKRGKPETIVNLLKKRKTLKNLRKYIPNHKKKEYASTLKKLQDKIYLTRRRQNNNLNNNTNAIGMLLEQEYKRNNPNINNIQSVSSSTKRLKPGKYKITKNNITKL